MTPKEPVLVIGAGGHAKVVISVLLHAGFRVKGLLDDIPEKQGMEILGVPIVGPVAYLNEAPEAHAVIAVGDNAARMRIAERYPETSWLTAIHPAAVVHESVELGPGTVVFAGAVVQPDCVLGRHVIVNTGATIDHDSLVDDFTHVAPGSHLAGNVRLGAGVFLGLGSAVVPGRRIGAWTTVGAGGVVTEDLPGGVVAVGTPARTIREN